MRQINLREYDSSDPHPLSVAERDALRAIPSLAVERADIEDMRASYVLTPGSTVGAVEIGDLSVLIRPKIPIPQLLSLACYAMGVFKRQETRLFDFKEEEALPDTLALALVSTARRAFARGLLHGYRTEEEALHTVRGRIMFAEQIRRRFGIPLPVEVRYDEFTDDVRENRLVKAAASKLGRMRLRSRDARGGLGWIAAMLDNVSPVEFPPNNVPHVPFDRLNEHYRIVVGLSRLILRHSAFESDRGAVRATGFLMDMNKLFQEFVTQALREALEVSANTFGERSIPSLDRNPPSNNRTPVGAHREAPAPADTATPSSGGGSGLDEGGVVRLRPDLVWREGSYCVFVGDAKYKNLNDSHVPNADLYQMLAYVTALDLPGGMLIYAKGEREPATHHVRHSGKRLEVAALDLSGTLDDVLKRVEGLAIRVKALRDDAGSLSRVA